MKQNFKVGDRLDVKVLDEWKAFEVVSFCDNWIEFKNPDGKNFSLGITINRNHIKFPDSKEKAGHTKKRGRKKKNK